MTVKRTILATVILLAATGVSAQPAEEAPPVETAVAGQVASASPSAATGAAEEPKEERKVCRTEKATGSLTRRNRICMTATQWREIYDNTRRGVSQMQGNGSGGYECVMIGMGACQGRETPGAGLPQY